MKKISKDNTDVLIKRIQSEQTKLRNINDNTDFETDITDNNNNLRSKFEVKLNMKEFIFELFESFSNREEYFLNDVNSIYDFVSMFLCCF